MARVLIMIIAGQSLQIQETITARVVLDQEADRTLKILTSVKDLLTRIGDQEVLVMIEIGIIQHPIEDQVTNRVQKTEDQRDTDIHLVIEIDQGIVANLKRGRLMELRPERIRLQTQDLIMMKV